MSLRAFVAFPMGSRFYISKTGNSIEIQDEFVCQVVQFCHQGVVGLD